MVFVLLLLVLWCRHSVTAADVYASHVYPYVSKTLTWLASPFGFSLTEIVVVLLVIALIRLIVRIFNDRKHWKKRLWRAVRLLLWTYAWFYAAWGINYYRSDIYARLGATPMPYEEAEFHEFLEEFAEQLNENWCPDATTDPGTVSRHVKMWYASLAPEAGLCQPRTWQHPKRQLFGRIYSSVGVLGYIGPFFDEMHLNPELTPVEYPFVFAHEYAHVLGVSSEAEANFWAFEASRVSDVQAIRYSAWFGLLSHSRHQIRSLLDEEGYQAWTARLRPEVIEDLHRTQQFWQSRRWTGLSRLQHRWYDFFLRRNRIAEGTGNYGQVLRLVLTFSNLHEHEDGEEG